MIWARKAFVEATATSGPARVPRIASDSRERLDQAVLTIASTLAPCSRAKRVAMSVSIVSPDWEIATTNVCGPITGSRYLNS